MLAEQLYSTIATLANDRAVEICGGYTKLLTGPDDAIEVRFHIENKLVVISVPYNGQPTLSLVNLDKVNLTVGEDEIEAEQVIPSPYDE